MGRDDRPCDFGKANREVEHTALWTDEPVQVFGSMVWHSLHEGGDGGQERLHVERGVECNHVRNQAGDENSVKKMCIYAFYSTGLRRIVYPKMNVIIYIISNLYVFFLLQYTKKIF